MSANSSGNGHRIKTNSPSRSQEGIFGVLRDQISKGWENGQTAGPIETKLCAIYILNSTLPSSPNPPNYNMACGNPLQILASGYPTYATCVKDFAGL